MKMKILLVLAISIVASSLYTCAHAAPATVTEHKEKTRELINTGEIFDQFTFGLFGFNFMRIASQFVNVSNGLKMISKITSEGLNIILLNSGWEIQAEVHQVLEDAIVKAQLILNPVLKRMSTILSLVSGADSLTAITVMADIIHDLSKRLSIEMQKANTELQTLGQQCIVKFTNIAVRIGSETVEKILKLLRNVMTKFQEVLQPLMSEVFLSELPEQQSPLQVAQHFIEALANTNQVRQLN